MFSSFKTRAVLIYVLWLNIECKRPLLRVHLCGSPEPEPIRPAGGVEASGELPGGFWRNAGSLVARRPRGGPRPETPAPRPPREEQLQRSISHRWARDLLPAGEPPGQPPDVPEGIAVSLPGFPLPRTSRGCAKSSFLN